MTEVRTSGEVVTTQERGTGYAVPVVRNVLEPRVQGVRGGLRWRERRSREERSYRGRCDRP
jgi:hypothetical protein